MLVVELGGSLGGAVLAPRPPPPSVPSPPVVCAGCGLAAFGSTVVARARAARRRGAVSRHHAEFSLVKSRQFTLQYAMGKTLWRRAAV